jgi:hypothetical protein
LKPEGAIKNGKSRDTGNNGHTRHMTQTNKRKNRTQKTKQESNTDLTKIETNPCFFHILEIHIKMKFYIIVILWEHNKLITTNSPFKLFTEYFTRHTLTYFKSFPSLVSLSLFARTFTNVRTQRYYVFPSVSTHCAFLS